MRSLITRTLLVLALALSPAHAAERPIRILCTTFPVCHFVRHIVEGRETAVHVGLMLPAAMGCPHDYVLTPGDMTKIAEADVLVANGLGLEEFLGAPLRRANANLRVIDSSRGIGETIPIAGGHEGQEPGARGHEHGGMNPHLFASPRMAAKIVRNLAPELAAIDPAGSALYRNNADNYAARLDRLADDLAAAVKGLRTRKIVTEHAVFDYLARDAGLDVAAVIEETPGTEPAASEMLRLGRAIKSSGAGAVFTDPQYPGKIGQTLAREAGVPAATLDPVASGPEDAPPDYYEQTMRANIATLKRVLGDRAN
jgi:zinc transport system substrate-binding protein